MIRYQDYAISFAENKRDGLTVCIISRVTHEKSGKMVRDPMESEGGVAYCSEKDGYDRVKGMRLALQRALNSSDLFSETDRKAIWAEWVRRYVRENKKERAAAQFVTGVSDIFNRHLQSQNYMKSVLK